MAKSYVNGVQFGVQPFCYHDLVMNIANRKSLIEKVKQNGFGLMELHATMPLTETFLVPQA
jgi:hypothetical protein